MGLEPNKFIIQEAINDPRDNQPKATPNKELEKVPIDLARLDMEVIIGSKVPLKLRGELINFLKNNLDVFFWSHKDMVSIDPKVIFHHQNIDPERKPVAQKRRKFGP